MNEQVQRQYRNCKNDNPATITSEHLKPTTRCCQLLSQHATQQGFIRSQQVKNSTSPFTNELVGNQALLPPLVEIPKTNDTSKFAFIVLETQIKSGQLDHKF